MSLPKRYDPGVIEPELQNAWQESGVYHFSPEGSGATYAIDTPPPTVSGRLHLGHVYSYTHADIMARFWRMNGSNVFYPMGYDDNGLPTERLVERTLGITAAQVGRREFIERCLEVGEASAHEYQALLRRLGLSVDWRYSYRTIGALSRRTSQYSFLDLYRKGLIYREMAPAIWCPECRTAIAQAELNDLERESEFVTLAFALEDGAILPIATTRPELLPACVAIFVHPEDSRFQQLIGQRARVPLFRQEVSILADPDADPEKGTGAVMCCTFGDTADVEWWRTHRLPITIVIARDGRLNEAAGPFMGLTAAEARRRVVEQLEVEGLVLDRRPVSQSVRVHERCDTPVEYIVTRQWFVRVLDFRDQLLEAGDKINWHPAHMRARYREWVENLRWDWGISRQRFFGVPFPVWYCDACGETVVANEDELPVDPSDQQPQHPCPCGGFSFTPEEDVMDTWATSSLSPQIVGRWLADDRLFSTVFPMSMRAQAHEIIRTWAFYTIVKAHHHFAALPWRDVFISGWGLAGEGAGKISKSRGGGPMGPMEMIERYSADAVRYWAASTGPGKDAVINEEKIQTGAKLVTKLWNVAGLSRRFLGNYTAPLQTPLLSPADRWILSRMQRLVARVTELLDGYEYAAAKNEVESFFWRELADNYLEMAKRRLYDSASPGHEGARYTLYHALLTVVKLFAPFLPYVTEQIYLGVYRAVEGAPSVHSSRWPVADTALIDDSSEVIGEALVDLATAVRRYKSEHSLGLSTELQRIQVVADATLADGLRAAEDDIISVTRALRIGIDDQLDPEMEVVKAEGGIRIGLER